jgi:hypothetical protein
VATAPRDPDADLAAARADLENLAGRLADATEELTRRIQEGPR